MLAYIKDTDAADTVEWMFCPFTRSFPALDEHFAETPSTPDFWQECKGQYCMAWQWKDEAKGLGYCGLVPHNK